MQKSPCARCGRMIARRTYISTRHAHKCPHGIQCEPCFGKPCQECKKDWPKFKELAGQADFEYQQSIARQSKRLKYAAN